MALYLSNSASHVLASSGGMTPVTGFHSTIDRPDSVSRVAPPTVSVTNIKAATANSQSLRARRRVSERGARRVMRSLGCRRRCGPYSRAGTAAIERAHAHPPTQAHWCDHANRPRGRMGAAGDGVRTIAAGEGQRRDRGDLLRGRRSRLGVAGDAAHSLDVAPGIAITSWGARSRALAPCATAA